MSTTSTLPDLHGRATARLPLADAFTFFPRAMGRWWPADYHLGTAEMVDSVVEPRAGGRWYERGADGTECDWGRVLVWEPPHRLVLTWQINGRWEYDPDPEHASEIEVRFTADGPDETIVDLEHRHLDRLVEARALRDGIVDSGGGWSALLEAYAAAAVDAERAQG